jgi:hypothetical protein
MKKLLVVLAALALTSLACTKDKTETAAAPKAPAAAPAPAAPAAVVPVKVEMKNLKVVATGWEGEFNATLEGWTYEKYTPGKDGTNEPNRFYLDKFPEDRPADAEGYAAKLKSDSNFQDMGSLFISVASTEKLPNGWLITGVQKDMNDKDDKGSPAFVLFRADLNVYCRGSVFKSEALRTEAIEGCKQLKP